MSRSRTPTKYEVVPAAATRRACKDVSKDQPPLYLQVAGELKRAITSGIYPVGSRLPTEVDLCDQFGISRFTARDALRVLSSAGLVTRRPRVGTIVVATPDDMRFSQDTASLSDLLQYAEDTELHFVYVGRVALSRAQARDFGVEAGTEWIFALGLRYQGTNDPRIKGKAAFPISVTRLFLNPRLKGIEKKLRARNKAVCSMIEREYQISIERVEQEMQGAVLDASDAANLGAEAGDPALRVVRRFFSGDGQLLEVAESIHPSDRFTYQMEFRK